MKERTETTTQRILNGFDPLKSPLKAALAPSFLSPINFEKEQEELLIEKIQFFNNYFTGYWDIELSDLELNINAGLPLLTMATPEHFNWSNLNNKSFLTTNLSQLSPTFCAASFAFAAVHAFSDRIKIQRLAKFPEIVISPQIILSCDPISKGCKGGNPWYVYKYIFEKTITAVTSSPQRNYGYTNGLLCSPSLFAKECSQFAKNCSVPRQFHVYKIESYGIVTGEKKMELEILMRGPIVCGMYINDDFIFYKNGILEDLDLVKTRSRSHAIEIYGYGVDKDGKYWLVRNSFGDYWGSKGLGKIREGRDDFLIESGNCAWAVPVKVQPEEVYFSTASEQHDKRNKLDNLNPVSADKKCRSRTQGNVITFSLLKLTRVPDTWDWRSVRGVNFITFEKNHTLPFYCGSCWAFGVAGMLSDRLNIVYPKLDKPINLSVQAIINCAGQGKGCLFGDPLKALEFAKSKGIPSETCNEYIAYDLKSCRADFICHVCHFPGEIKRIGNKRCKGLTSYLVYQIESFGRVVGEYAMKEEIFRNGPIECGVEVNDQLRYMYRGDVLRAQSEKWNINHSVEVVGWATNSKGQYWIVKNFWGDSWGDGGYMYLEMGKNVLGIEEDCTWGKNVKEKIVQDKQFDEAQQIVAAKQQEAILENQPKSRIPESIE